MSAKYAYGVWWLDSTRKALLIFTASGVTGGCIGAGVAWLLVGLHDLSPDNSLAGLAFSAPATLAGLAAGLLIIRRIGRKQ